MDIFHDALVEQCFAHIAVEQGQPRQTEHGDSHDKGQHGLISAKAPYIVQVKGMGRQMDDACSREERQLD